MMQTTSSTSNNNSNHLSPTSVVAMASSSTESALLQVAIGGEEEESDSDSDSKTTQDPSEKQQRLSSSRHQQRRDDQASRWQQEVHLNFLQRHNFLQRRTDGRTQYHDYPSRGITSTSPPVPKDNHNRMFNNNNPKSPNSNNKQFPFMMKCNDDPTTTRAARADCMDSNVLVEMLGELSFLNLPHLSSLSLSRESSSNSSSGKRKGSSDDNHHDDERSSKKTRTMSRDEEEDNNNSKQRPVWNQIVRMFNFLPPGNNEGERSSASTGESSQQQQKSQQPQKDSPPPPPPETTTSTTTSFFSSIKAAAVENVDQVMLAAARRSDFSCRHPFDQEDEDVNILTTTTAPQGRETTVTTTIATATTAIVKTASSSLSKDHHHHHRDLVGLLSTATSTCTDTEIETSSAEPSSSMESNRTQGSGSNDTFQDDNLVLRFGATRRGVCLGDSEDDDDGNDNTRRHGALTQRIPPLPSSWSSSSAATAWSLLQTEPLDDLENCPRILTPAMMQQLHQHGIPPSLQLYEWKRIYAIGRDGDAFCTFLESCAAYRYTMVLIRTHNGHVLGGFCSHTWQAQDGFDRRHCYYGDGQSFLFSQRDDNNNDKNHDDVDDSQQQEQPQPFNLYRWTGSNDYCQVCDGNKQMVGMGGVGDFGWIVQDSFWRGQTGRCGTYGNPPLVPATVTTPRQGHSSSTTTTTTTTTTPKDNKKSKMDDESSSVLFEVADFEVYGLVPLALQFSPGTLRRASNQRHITRHLFTTSARAYSSTMQGLASSR